MMNVEIIITLLILLVLLIAFIWQKIEIELSAFVAVTVFLALGVLSTKDILGVFSNSAAMTVATMFILSSALEKTGAIDFLGVYLLKKVEANPKTVIFITFSLVFISSAFINNTSVVLVMIPIVISLAQKLNKSPSKLLIPLSYIAIFGGACTLVGTSTNLLVDAVAQDLGQKPFGLFEASIPALIMSVFGVLYLYFFSQKLLPSEGELVSSGKSNNLAFHFEIPISSVLYNKDIEQLKDEFCNSLIQSLKIYSWNEKSSETKKSSIFKPIISLFRPLKNEIVLQNKRLILIGDIKKIMEISISSILEPKYIIDEFIIPDNSPLRGMTIGEINENGRYGFKIVSLRNYDLYDEVRFDSFKLELGDIVIATGLKQGFEYAIEFQTLAYFHETNKKVKSGVKTFIASFSLILAIFFSATNLFPIAGACLIATAIVLITRCLTLNEAYNSLKADVLFLIYFMLAISKAMENSGTLKLFTDVIFIYLENLPPWIIISILYLFTSTLTEIFSNSAAALMLTPIAITIATQMGIDPHALQATIMIGASASFATPLGYQTNTLVFSAGNYKFRDFLQIGLPLNIVMWLVASLVIPLYWGLF